VSGDLPIELYVEAHYAAWHYEKLIDRKLTPMELRNFVIEYAENSELDKLDT